MGVDPARRLIHPSRLFKSWAQAERVSLLTEKTFFHEHYRAMTTGLAALAAAMFAITLLKALAARSFARRERKTRKTDNAAVE